MTNALIKTTNTRYLPGSPGVPASTGQPYLPARTVYETKTVCGWEWPNGGTWQQVKHADGTTDWVFVPNLSAGSLSAAQVYVCRTQTVPVSYPEQMYIAPTPGVPGSPSQFLNDFNLGWNAGARSLAWLPNSGSFRFSVPRSTTGAFVGLNDADLNAGYAEIDHALYFSHGVARVYESGTEKFYAGAYLDADVFKIRRAFGTVTYLKNDTVFYTSAVPSEGAVFVDTSLYTGGDRITDPAFLNEGYATNSFEPMTGFGGKAAYAFSDTSFAPMTGTSRQASRGDASFEPMTGVGSNRLYGESRNSFAPMTGSGFGGMLQPSYAVSDNAFVSMTGTASGLTGTIGGGNNSFAAMTGYGANKPYGEARNSFEPMTGFAHNYIPKGEAHFFSAALGSSTFEVPVELYVAMNSSAQVTSVFALGLILDASLKSQVTAASTLAVQAVLNALMYSTAGANSAAITPNTNSGSTVWVVNTDSLGSTRYEDFPFNSFATLNGVAYGAKADGLYRLEGATDAGAAIRAMVSFGKQDFGTSAEKRITNAYIGCSSTGRLFLRVIAEGQSYTYAARASSETMNVQRIDPGRGIKANWLEFELYNADGDDFELASVEFLAVPTSRRI